MAQMSELWSKRGISDLALSSQNLRVKWRDWEKKFGNAQETILRNAGGEECQLVEHGEGENLLFEDQESNIEAKQSTAENLHKYLEPEDTKNLALNQTPARTISWKLQYQYLPQPAQLLVTLNTKTPTRG